MKRALLTILVAGLYLLHQDTWNWRTTQPLLFGFLPVGLTYHVVYSVAAALLMGLLVKYAWPAALERDVESKAEAPPPHGEDPH